MRNGCRRKEFNSPFQFLYMLRDPPQYSLTVLVFVTQALVDLRDMVHSYIFMQEEKTPRKTASIILLFPRWFLYKPSHSCIVGSQEIEHQTHESLNTVKKPDERLLSLTAKKELTVLHAVLIALI